MALSQGLAACATPTPSSVQQSAAPPPVRADYPAWTVADESENTAVMSTSAGATYVREDRYFGLSRPEGGQPTITALYSRSSPDAARLPERAWTNIDTLFRGSNPDASMALSLAEEFALDHPRQRLLGAYRSGTHGALASYNVGFFEGRPSASWIRGEYVYVFDPHGGTWRQVKDDSGSDSVWNTAGPVE